MPLGPGKYDEELSIARLRAGATSAVLIVIDGRRGPGFACHTPPQDLPRLVAILRNVADQMEQAMKGAG